MADKLKTVFLTVGPRGAGKSEYCQRLLNRQKDFFFISRDEILMRMFGSVHTSPYEGGSASAEQSMRMQIMTALAGEESVKILLDAWTGFRYERERIIANCREWGAHEVVALFFVTPVKYVNEWFWKKPGIARIGEMGKPRNDRVVYFSDDSPRRDYELFHRNAALIREEGFNRVVLVNPLQLEFPF